MSASVLIITQLQSLPRLNEDFSVTHPKKSIEKKMEEQFISCSQPILHVDRLDTLYQEKENLFTLRNEIIDNIFKRYFPYYKKRLQQLKIQLKEVDKEIYELEKEQRLKTSDIENMLEEAQKSVCKYQEIINAAKRKQIQSYGPTPQ
ncbi:hypothetical protein [Legionella sainthelensi]|uniref:hypothetical protein n=1 Tax=Legionella sainthelensi TaxID=28087 RepID=UPI000E2069FA|nr:hypothetical protein [Legionella sainthelensi]